MLEVRQQLLIVNPFQGKFVVHKQQPDALADQDAGEYSKERKPQHGQCAGEPPCSPEQEREYHNRGIKLAHEKGIHLVLEGGLAADPGHATSVVLTVDVDVHQVFRASLLHAQLGSQRPSHSIGLSFNVFLIFSHLSFAFIDLSLGWRSSRSPFPESCLLARPGCWVGRPGLVSGVR